MQLLPVLERNDQRDFGRNSIVVPFFEDATRSALALIHRRQSFSRDGHTRIDILTGPNIGEYFGGKAVHERGVEMVPALGADPTARDFTRPREAQRERQTTVVALVTIHGRIEAHATIGSQAGLKNSAGDKMRLYDLGQFISADGLRGIMIPSGVDALFPVAGPDARRERDDRTY